MKLYNHKSANIFFVASLFLTGGLLVNTEAINAKYLNSAGGNIFGNSDINPMANPNVNPMANPNVNPMANPNVNPMANPNVNACANPDIFPFGCE